MASHAFEFLVEEQSAEVALGRIIPRIIGTNHTFRIHPHQGKPDLLKKLPAKLRGYGRYAQPDWRIVVLVDCDNDDCHALKEKLEDASRKAKLITKAMSGCGQSCTVLNRIAIEELEAWFFGDMSAVRLAFPKVPPTIERKAEYRDPDRIRGGTAEKLQRVLGRVGYYPGNTFRKIDVATRISESMDPASNSSRSFQVFRDGLLALLR